MKVFSSNASTGPPHGGYCSHVCRSPSCRQKALPCPRCGVWKRKTDDKRWRKPQYLSSVHGKNYNRKERGGSFLESSIREEPNHTPAMSYFRFKAMHSSKENVSGVKEAFDETCAIDQHSPLMIWMFISWQFLQTALLQSMYR